MALFDRRSKLERNSIVNCLNPSCFDNVAIHHEGIRNFNRSLHRTMSWALRHPESDYSRDIPKMSSPGDFQHLARGLSTTFSKKQTDMVLAHNPQCLPDPILQRTTAVSSHAMQSATVLVARCCRSLWLHGTLQGPSRSRDYRLPSVSVLSCSRILYPRLPSGRWPRGTGVSWQQEGAG